jgi:streptogramin lyase
MFVTTPLHAIPPQGPTAHLSWVQSTIGNGLSMPGAVALDGSGNVYVSDSRGGLLKETLSGGSYTQSVVAGGPYPFSHGVAVDGSGNLYICDWFGNQVLKETLSGGSYTQSTIGSGLSRPWNVALDGSGNVYISDGWNARVLKETLSGGGYTQSVIASGLNQPYGIAVDSNNNVYFSDSGNIYKETPSGVSYTQSVIASGLSEGYGMAVDGTGNVYIADNGNNRVVKETPSGSSYTQSVFASGLNFPDAVAVDGLGNVYISDYSNNRVLKEGPSGGNFGTVLARSTSPAMTLTFAFDTAGSLNTATPYQVLTQGATGLDFADATTGTCAANHGYNAGDTCTVDVTFTPKFASLRYGAVVLNNGSGNAKHFSNCIVFPEVTSAAKHTR